LKFSIKHNFRFSYKDEFNQFGIFKLFNMNILSMLICLKLLVFQQAFAKDISYSTLESWHRLIHYEFDLTSPSGYSSAIHSPDFFLSEEGLIDPEKELQATITEMLKPLTINVDQHARCRFPARLIWLNKNIPEFRALQEIPECIEFNKWANLERLNSISIVFANGYLSNPASYYGHIFLKFNYSKSANQSSLLDMTINFGAIEAQKDDPISYVVKGITGGYDGGFSPIEFYFHDKNYGENELRDLWEYQLNLPTETIQFIISHAWEVLNKKYVYYFFHDNCAFRVAEFLQLNDDLRVVHQNLPWVIPQSILNELENISIKGLPLIKKRIFHASRETRFNEKFSILPSDEQIIFKKIIAGEINLKELQNYKLSEDQQKTLLDALIDYYQYRFEVDHDKKIKTVSPDYNTALKMRLQLPINKNEKFDIQSNYKSPSLGRNPSLIQLTGSTIFNKKDSSLNGALRIRPVYYDLLDSESHQVNNSSLSMGDLELGIYENGLRINKLDILSIDSMNSTNSGLPSDTKFGWRFRTGFEQERIYCYPCLIPRIQSDIGIGNQILGPNLFASAHLGGALQTDTDIDGIGFTRLSTTIIYRPIDELGIHLQHEERMSFHNSTFYRTDNAEIRYSFNSNYDLRVKWENDHKQQLSLKFGYYW
jgi:hypothetical protein